MRLTPREREVMELLLVAGKTSKEVAVAMNVSVRTVEGHRRMVFSKMHLSSAAQLVRTLPNVRDPAQAVTLSCSGETPRGTTYVVYRV